MFPVCAIRRSFVRTFVRPMLVVGNEFRTDHVQPAIRIAIELQLHSGSIDISEHRYRRPLFHAEFINVVKVD